MPRREWNETSFDLKREGVVAGILSDRGKGCDGWFKNPVGLHIDVSMVLGDRVVSFCEIKCRNDPSTAYRTAYISMIKVYVGLALEVASGLPVYFCWAWSDNVMTLCRVRPPGLITITGNDRGQPGDKEPCGHYEMSQMQTYKADWQQQLISTEETR